jgi:hypothetical protein
MQSQNFIYNDIKFNDRIEKEVLIVSAIISEN